MSTDMNTAYQDFNEIPPSLPRVAQSLTTAPDAAPDATTTDERPAARETKRGASARRATADRKRGGRPLRRDRSFPERIFDGADRHVHDAVAGILLIVAIIVLVETAFTFATFHPFSPAAAMAVVADVMVAVIIVEIMRTVQMPRESGVRRIQAFLVIGIIGAVREVLASSADLTLKPDSPTASTHAVLLLVSVGVVIGLTVSLVLLKRLGSSFRRPA